MWFLFNLELKWKARIKDHIVIAARLEYSCIENGEKQHC